jgi:multidrug efflux pump subunit AcrA (membrane-fusion protein)
MLLRFLPLAILALTIGLLTSGCNLMPTREPPTPVPQVLEPARHDNIVAAEAVIVPVRQADLGFKLAGRTAQVLVSEGDFVVAGQELMRLETRDLDHAVLQAEAALAAAKTQLAKVEAGVRPEEIEAAKATLSIAQAAVDAAESAVLVAQGNLAMAEAALPSAQAAYQKLLDGPDADELAAVGAALEQARVVRDQAQQVYDQVSSLPNASMTPQALQLQQATVAYDAAAAQYRLVERGATTAELTAAQSLVFQAQAGIDIASAQVSQAEAQVESATAQAAQAQARLDLLLTGAQPEDIAIARSAVDQAEVALTAAENMLEDAVLVAPFDGIVAAVLVEQGEVTTPQFPAVRIGDLSTFIVQTEDLSEVDIDRVRVGQEATISIDALGGAELASTVSRIAAIATELRGDKVYAVEMDLDPSQTAGLRWGMSAYVEITTG